MHVRLTNNNGDVIRLFADPAKVNFVEMFQLFLTGFLDGEPVFRFTPVWFHQAQRPEKVDIGCNGFLVFPDGKRQPCIAIGQVDDVDQLLQ